MSCPHERSESKAQPNIQQKRLLTSTALVLMLPFAGAPALAADWTGAVDDHWFTAGNWSTGIEPDLGEDVSIDTGAANAPVIPDVIGLPGSHARSDNIFIGDTNVGVLHILGSGRYLFTDDTAIIGRNAGSLGTVFVRGRGYWNTANLFVGDEGRGELLIAHGGRVNVRNQLDIGRADLAGRGDGTVTVEGLDSMLEVHGMLNVGLSGDGVLIILDSGSVGSDDATIGGSSTGVGSVNISSLSADRSFWRNRGLLDVGGSGEGRLSIGVNGALINSSALFIGNGTGSLGRVDVSGQAGVDTNALLFVGGDLVVGEAGRGELTISNGGWVVPDTVRAGNAATGDGTIVVAGEGSLLATPDSEIVIGAFGEGRLNIRDGAQVTIGAGGTGRLILADRAGSNALLAIGGPDEAVPAILDFARIEFGEGNAQFWVTHGASDYVLDVDLATNLGGPGGTLMIDAGTTIYTGDGNAFSGTTNIWNGARFVVNSTLGGMVNVLPGGFLGGSGTVGGLTVLSTGTVAPGNSIGTLNVAGDVTFAPGSIYEVEVNAAGDSDLIHATGIATLNGGAVMVVPFPDFSAGTAYTILTADGGLLGAGFDDAVLSGGSLFIAPTLTYDLNNAYLTLTQTSDFASVALTPNQIAAAGGIQSLGGGSLFSAVGTLADADMARAAFDAASGEIHASTKTALIEDTRFPREAALERLRVTLGGIAGVGPGRMENPTPEDSALWGQIFGAHGRWNGDGNAATMERSIAGLVLGGEGEITDNVRFGFLGGYTNSNLSVSDRNSSSAATSLYLGAFGGGEWDGFSLSGGAIHGWHDIDTFRNAVFTGFSDSLSGSYGARSLQAFGEAAYGIDAGNGRFEPFANLAHVHLSTDGYSETGGAAALTANSQTMNTTFATLGLRAETELELGETAARLSGSIGWRHAFGDTPTATHALAGGSGFTVAGVPIAQDTLVLDLGASVNLTENAALGLSYNGQFGGGLSDHTLKANLGVRF